MSETLRAIDFDGYLDIVDQLVTDVFTEPHYWVTGTLAPTRDWEDLIDVIDGVVGLRTFTRPEEDWEDWNPYEDLPDRFHAEIPMDVNDGVKQFANWKYPSWAFVDEESTEDIERADAQLAGVAAFPEDAVRTEDHRVLSPAEYMERIEALQDHYGDEYILMTGVFSPPGGGFSIQDSESVHRIGMNTFPAGVFANSGISSIKSAKTTLGGALILRRDDVTSDVLDIVDGEAEEVGPDE